MKTIISPEMEVFMKLHKIETIEELLKHQAENLLKMEGFGYRLLRQYLDFRNEKKLPLVE